MVVGKQGALTVCLHCDYSNLCIWCDVEQRSILFSPLRASHSWSYRNEISMRLRVMKSPPYWTCPCHVCYEESLKCLRGWTIVWTLMNWSLFFWTVYSRDREKTVLTLFDKLDTTCSCFNIEIGVCHIGSAVGPSTLAPKLWFGLGFKLGESRILKHSS